jgi:hypothetical protein
MKLTELATLLRETEGFRDIDLSGLFSEEQSLVVKGDHTDLYLTKERFPPDTAEMFFVVGHEKFTGVEGKIAENPVLQVAHRIAEEHRVSFGPLPEPLDETGITYHSTLFYGTSPEQLGEGIRGVTEAQARFSDYLRDRE